VLDGMFCRSSNEELEEFAKNLLRICYKCARNLNTNCTFK
jgi:hypothetical protein